MVRSFSALLAVSLALGIHTNAATYAVAAKAAATYAVAATTAETAGDGAGCGAEWRRPVEAPVLDWFRPPPTPFQSGNRGHEYGTMADDEVVAVADGRVTFAGPVGRHRFVVITHPSGIRSTYGFVTEILVEPGSEVGAGLLIAVTGPGFHLTARRGDDYLDPAVLLADPCRPVRLVPVPRPAERNDGSGTAPE